MKEVLVPLLLSATLLCVPAGATNADNRSCTKLKQGAQTCYNRAKKEERACLSTCQKSHGKCVSDAMKDYHSHPKFERGEYNDACMEEKRRCADDYSDCVHECPDPSDTCASEKEAWQGCVEDGKNQKPPK